MNTSLTQQYSTWGDKLLQHCDVLDGIQNERRLTPITVQLAPTEVCDSNCTFCSVANRPKGIIPFEDIRCGLKQFYWLQAKSLEITGGGNPLLYRDGDKRICDVINYASELKYKIGIVTNSECPARWLNFVKPKSIQWVRVSLAKLDEGLTANDYELRGVDYGIGLSYIVSAKTTEHVFEEIVKILSMFPHCRFVRIAPDCTTDDALDIDKKWGPVIKRLDSDGKFFIKEIGGNYFPFKGGCWVGALRPYWTSTGIYICSSHVLKTRKYEPEWRLCGPSEIFDHWIKMNNRFKSGLPPYEIDISKCWHCYYFNNNKLLDTVINRLPDWEFA